MILNLIIIAARTIPTGVGKTYRLSMRGARNTDHPHGRGENHIRETYLKSKIGPSPRAWGKQKYKRIIVN